MDAVSTLVKSIFHRESLRDCSVEELQTLAQQYPYFAPAQFLFAEKLRSANDDRYQEQMQKLSLHFNNPLWLDYLVNGYNAETETETTVETDAGRATFDEENVGQNKIETTFIKSEIEITEPIREEVSQSLNKAPDESNETPGIEEQLNEVVAQETVEASNAEIAATGDDELTRTQGESVQEKRQEATAFADASSEIQSESVPSHEEELTGSPVMMPEMPDLKKAPESELTFEPYHTVDYFASQGIKFVPEEKPRDRFGQQLKSFTEWLKTMKRLPYHEIAKSGDASADVKVQQLADHSISEEEVVTETMAEVWVKQGNKEKAIETYNKLSLLNPDKSAYFASLIEQLKNS